MTADRISAKDAYEVMGGISGDFSVQELIDAIANKVMNKLALKTDLSKYALAKYVGVTSSFGMTNISYSYPGDNGSIYNVDGVENLRKAIYDSSHNLTKEINKKANAENVTRKLRYTNEGVEQDITLSYNTTYFLVLTKNYAQYREDNNFYIVSTPGIEGVRGIVQKIFGAMEYNITINNNILKIIPPNADWASVCLIEIS